MSCSDEGSETNEVDDTWEEDWGDYDDLQCVSLFTPKKFPSMDECFEHDAKHHEFDLRLFRREVRCMLTLQSAIKFLSLTGSQGMGSACNSCRMMAQ
jgi:hypothetical protein